MGPLWWAPEVANHEAPEQRRLSASECDSVKGQQGPLGSVLEGGVSNGRGTKE